MKQQTFKYFEYQLHPMGTITININDETEKKFREKARQLYGLRKGALGQAVMEALQEWSRKKTHIDRCMTLLEKGIDMGKIQYKNREELHDRN